MADAPCILYFTTGKVISVESLGLQVFHLPEAMLQQAQSRMDASVDADVDGECLVQPDVFEQQGSSGASATGTGRWGKQMHEPSPFLSHELWGKLGKA